MRLGEFSTSVDLLGFNTCYLKLCILKDFIFIYVMCAGVCVCTCLHAYICVQAPMEVRSPSDALELELQKVVVLVWMLGTEPGSSVRAASE